MDFKGNTSPHARMFDMPFVIRRLDTAGCKVSPQIPSTVSQSNCFLYLRAGELLADIGTEPFLVKADEFLFIPPAVPFSVKYYNGSIGYMGAFSNRVLKSSHFGLLHRHQPVIVDIPLPERDFVAGLAEKLCRETGMNLPSVSDVMLSSVLDLLLTQLDFLVGDDSVHVRNALCSAFLDCVFDRSEPVAGVSVYAHRLGVSASHLNRVVKSETGRSAGEWIDISRISAAKLLLRQTDMSIIDIAHSIGFEDQSYFSRFFRKHTSLTPSGFRSADL